MQKIDIARSIKAAFPYEQTRDQASLTDHLSAFLTDKDPASMFLLKGYAGTGKTSIVSSLVRVLPGFNLKTVLLAPTGRAAKVLAGYSGKQALTIHKKIYRIQTAGDGSVQIVRQENKHSNTIFIVDEASMIPGSNTTEQGSLFGRANLLDDLIEYVYNQRNCRLIFIGDTAQLPPVRSTESPALSKTFLEQAYQVHIREYELMEVVRQAKNSGILHNATRIRHLLSDNTGGFPPLQTERFRDVIRVQGQEAADEVDTAFLSGGKEQALMICRSNKRANLFNQHIRQRVLFMEDEINAGDLLMVVRNNYYWLPATSEAGFIANGDILELTRIQRTEDIYGFRFADVTARLTDYPDMPELDVKLMLDTLQSETPALPEREARTLFDAVAEDFKDIPNKRTRMSAIKKSPYLNALQVKYAYAMTCHKAQGGQWENVFVEMGYLPEKKPDTEYLRWLYTAFTRGTDKVFLLNFTDDFFATE
ncbi:MAG: ATP-dependent RecD-like DNA helicase [Bacteroidales bacterium]